MTTLDLWLIRCCALALLQGLPGVFDGVSARVVSAESGVISYTLPFLGDLFFLVRWPFLRNGGGWNVTSGRLVSHVSSVLLTTSSLSP